MAVVTMKQLLESGVHFGHQTRRWNPKMRRYIFTERSGIYIIDLLKTLEGIERSYTFVRDLTSKGGTVLFVGTKKQIADAIADEAKRVGMPFVNYRWLGGMLTNFQTVHSRVAKLLELERIVASGEADQMLKKEGLKLRRELAKLERNLGGIRGLQKAPSAIFVIDTKKEHIAVTEARKLNIPVIAIVDTNCDPDEVDYVIPGNDDAIRAVSLVTRVLADALAEGYGMAKDDVIERSTSQALPVPSGPRPQAAPAAVDETPSAEEAAEIAATTVFEPDVSEPEIVAEPTEEQEATSDESSPAPVGGAAEEG